MWNLVLQCVVPILTAIGSIISLQKETRSRSGIIKKEAVRVIVITCGTAIMLIVNSVVSYYSSKDDKKKLKLSLDSIKAVDFNIREQNEELSRALSDSSLSQSRLITASQQKSANQLESAASNLSNEITGAEKPPIFSFAVESKSIVGTIKNVYDKPIHNFSFKISNFTNIKNCPIMYLAGIKSNMILEECYKNNTNFLGIIPVMAVGEASQIALPKYDSLKRGKYFIEIYLKNKVFIEEAIYQYSNVGFEQSIRIVQVSSDLKKIIKSWVVKNDKGIKQLMRVNWKEEFPDMYITNIGMGDFKSSALQLHL